MLNYIDIAFADMLIRRSGLPQAQNDDLRVLFSAVIQAVREGHSGLALEPWSATQEKPAAFWKELLDTLPPILLSTGAGVDQPTSPLVRMTLSNGETMLYLNRFDACERIIAQGVMARITDMPPFSDDVRAAVHGISSYFDNQPFESDAQQRAVAVAYSSNIAIVTGGPGTGKTTVLAAILAMELMRNPDLRVMLAAPTGKAAARMAESIREQLENLRASAAVKERLRKLSSATLHRLLRISERTGEAGVSAEKPLETDLIAVDECSMMSLPLFCQLIQAVKPQTRILLLGDKDQLPSVEVGNVLAELCRALILAPHRVYLTKNYRSREIPELCNFVQKVVENTLAPSDYQAFYEAPASAHFSAVELSETNQTALEEFLRTTLRAAGVHFHARGETIKSPAEAWKMADSFKVLCAVNDGPFGVDNMNNLLRKVLRLDAVGFPNGLPILICENDAATGLTNGDIGVCFEGRVYFPRTRFQAEDFLVATSGQGSDVLEFSEDRAFLPSELPLWKCALAMSIHKSQGSGYDTVVTILPDAPMPILTRELVYTAITRAKKYFRLAAPRQILETALCRQSTRWSAMTERLA